MFKIRRIVNLSRGTCTPRERMSEAKPMETDLVTDYEPDCVRVDGKPGRYIVSSSFNVDGKPYKLAYECNNPAFGRRVLNEREADIIDPPTREKEAA